MPQLPSGCGLDSDDLAPDECARAFNLTVRCQERHTSAFRLLVIDDLGYLPIDADGARLLFQVSADAYEQRSLIITTNLKFSRWGTVFGDDNMAATIIDRLVHHGRLLQFRCDSYRMNHALMKQPPLPLTRQENPHDWPGN